MSETARKNFDDYAPDSLSALLSQGLELFDEQLQQTDDSDLGRSTPCADWTVEDLIRHTADTADRAAAILQGREWAADTSTATAVERWRTSSRTLLEVLGEVDTDDRWPLPDDSPLAKLRFHGCDFTVHRWDLARSVGDEPVLPEGWVSYMDEFFRSLPAEVLRRPGAFGPPVDPAPEDGSAEQLMAFLGRDTRR